MAAPASSEFIPREQWGRDHWSVLAYLETRAVEREPIDFERLRINPARHPERAGTEKLRGKRVWRPEWGTRLRDDTRSPDHDDWDCVEDLQRAGLVVVTGGVLDARPGLTTEGWVAIQALRRHKAVGGSFATFARQEEALAQFRLSLGKALDGVIAASNYYARAKDAMRAAPPEEVEAAVDKFQGARRLVEQAVAAYCDLRAASMADIMMGEQDGQEEG
jgi:hypothetical protein